MLGNGYLQPNAEVEQIMGMPATQLPAHRWSEDEFYTARDAAPAGERWELVDGEVLVTPSPHWSHQLVSASLFRLLDAYVRREQLGRVITAPMDVRLQPGLITQPDLLVVPMGHLDTRDHSVSSLLLAIEILSPSSARFDRVVKRPRYQANHVPEYWIVDRESGVIERWQEHDERPAIVSDQLEWRPIGASVALELDVAALFRDADIR